MNSNKMFKIISPKDIEYNLIHTKQIVFEITDKCNLSCKYCGYADLYEGYDVRKGKELPFEKAKLLVDYLYSLWEQNRVNGVIEPVTIGFYGGEPLLNVNFMHQIISYIEKQDFVGKVFSYNMTTNAMMLNKYMDFIVENEMQLLISLDGNETGQSYSPYAH